jgi:hypothetical protein
MLFLHERTSKGGNRRLVALYGWLHDDLGSYTPRPLGESRIWSIAIDLVLLKPATLREDLVEVDSRLSGHAPSLTYAWAKQARVFAGQPDPNDASHFTIQFEADGKPGTIEGWLNDDDSVTLKVHGAPAPVVEEMDAIDSVREQMRKGG